jgi:hypothetical protein
VFFESVNLFFPPRPSNLGQHTIVTPGVYRRNAECQFRTTSDATLGGHPNLQPGKLAVRTCNSFWNPNEATEEHGIGEIFMG